MLLWQVTRDKEDQVTNAKRQSDAMQLKLNSQVRLMP